MSPLPAGLWRKDEMLLLRGPGWTCLLHTPQHMASAPSPRVWQDRWSGRPTVDQPQARASLKIKLRCCSVCGASVVSPTLQPSFLCPHLVSDSTTHWVGEEVLGNGGSSPASMGSPWDKGKRSHDELLPLCPS